MDVRLGWMLALASLLVPGPALSAAAEPGPLAGEWRYLCGEWVGSGGGRPGEAVAGSFRVDPELDGRVLVRRSFAEYAATAERPAYRHDDWMVIYREAPGAEVRALYLDNEGHVIHYEAVADTAAGTFVLTSRPDPRLPRFRFRYRALTADSLAYRFEIAPPGKPDSLAVYVSGTARRKR